MLIYDMDTTALLPLISAAYSGARIISRDSDEIRVKKLPSGPLYFPDYFGQWLGREKLCERWWKQSAMSQCLFDGRLARIYHPYVIQEDGQKDKWEIRDSAPKQTKLHRNAALISWSQSLQGTMTLMNEALSIASLPRTLTLHPPSCPLLRDPWSRNCWFSLVNVYFYLKYQASGPELRKGPEIQLSQGLYAHYSTLTMSIVMALSQGFVPTRVPETDASRMLPIIVCNRL